MGRPTHRLNRHTWRRYADFMCSQGVPSAFGREGPGSRCDGQEARGILEEERAALSKTLEMRRMSTISPEIWLLAADGHDVIRASAVVAVHLDATGAVAVRLNSMAHTAMTLMVGTT